MIVYAPSYAGLVQALKITSWENLTVFSNNASIIEFCEFTKIKYTKIVTTKPTSRKELKEYKVYLKEYAATISGNDVLFCFYGFDILGLYFMYELKRKNKVFFHNKDHDFSKIATIDLFKRKKDFIDYLVYYYTLGISYSFYIINQKRVFFGLPPSILKKDFLSINIDIDNELFETNKIHFSKLLEIPDNSVIFVDQGSISINISDKTIEWLEITYKNRIIFIKAHPNFPLSNSLLKKFKEIPSYIPLDLLINSKIELVGIYSTVLLDSVDTCKVTSILDLVEWKSMEEYEKYKTIVSKSKKIIIIKKQ